MERLGRAGNEGRHKPRRLVGEGSQNFLLRRRRASEGLAGLRRRRRPSRRTRRDDDRATSRIGRSREDGEALRRMGQVRGKGGPQASRLDRQGAGLSLRVRVMAAREADNRLLWRQGCVPYSERGRHRGRHPYPHQEPGVAGRRRLQDAPAHHRQPRQREAGLRL